MDPIHSVATLHHEDAQQAFLERFGNIRPELMGSAINEAFLRGFDRMSDSEHVEALEREMERLLGIISDEEE